MKWLKRMFTARKASRAFEQYEEGIRLMRHGDGMDEYLGMHIAREARAELNSLGWDVDGTQPHLERYSE